MQNFLKPIARALTEGPITASQIAKKLNKDRSYVLKRISDVNRQVSDGTVVRLEDRKRKVNRYLLTATDMNGVVEIGYKGKDYRKARAGIFVAK